MLLENKNTPVYGVVGAIARAFVCEPARVFLAGRTLATLEEVAGAAQVDALDEEGVDPTASTILKRAKDIYGCEH